MTQLCLDPAEKCVPSAYKKLLSGDQELHFSYNWPVLAERSIAFNCPELHLELQYRPRQYRPSSVTRHLLR